MSNCKLMFDIWKYQGGDIIKKKIIIISTLIISIIITLTFIVINCNGRKKSVKEALGIGSYNNLKIIHEEYTDKGIITFMINTDTTKKYLSTAFISKNLFGYKDLYSGVGSIDGVGERDLTAHYFPAIKKTSLPIYFGVILNDKIDEVIVKQGNSSEMKNAKIIDAGDTRIWLIYMNGFKGTEFEVIGYSSDGTEIYKFTDTIPWNAEQKPVKSPYE